MREVRPRPGWREGRQVGERAPGPSLPPTTCLMVGQLPDLSEPPFPFFEMERVTLACPHLNVSPVILMLDFWPPEK